MRLIIGYTQAHQPFLPPVPTEKLQHFIHPTTTKKQLRQMPHLQLREVLVALDSRADLVRRRDHASGGSWAGGRACGRRGCMAHLLGDERRSDEGKARSGQQREAYRGIHRRHRCRGGVEQRVWSAASVILEVGCFRTGGS